MIAWAGFWIGCGIGLAGAFIGVGVEEGLKALATTHAEDPS